MNVGLPVSALAAVVYDIVLRFASVALETPALHAAPPIVSVPVAGHPMISTDAMVSPSTSEYPQSVASVQLL